LAAALAQAQVASVAVVDGRLAGYQISTASALGAHLARLAVGPEAQGEGVGRALVIDALHAHVQRGFAKVTVNTQTDNAPALQLYGGLGFLRTEQQYPIYQMEVARSEQPSGGISQ
jgi:ribosomal protein S18 acetylase RimI-like enzyme